MDKDTSKAIADVSKRLNAVERDIEKLFLELHQENENKITDTEDALIEIAGMIGGE